MSNTQLSADDHPNNKQNIPPSVQPNDMCKCHLSTSSPSSSQGLLQAVLHSHAFCIANFNPVDTIPSI